MTTAPLPIAPIEVNRPNVDEIETEMRSQVESCRHESIISCRECKLSRSVLHLCAYSRARDDLVVRLADENESLRADVARLNRRIDGIEDSIESLVKAAIHKISSP